MNSRIVVALTLALQLAATHDGAAQAAAARPSRAKSDAVVAQEQSVLDAIARKDTVGFNKVVGRDFVYVDQRGAMEWKLSKTSTLFPACYLGTGWTIDHPMTTEVGSEIVVLTYSSHGKAVCDGRPAPSPVNVLSVWRRAGDRWVAVAHSETPAVSGQQKP